MRMTQVRVKIIPIEDCSWDCSMKEAYKFLSITYTMIKCIKEDALYLLMNKRLDKRYVYMSLYAKQSLCRICASIKLVRF